MSRSLKKSPFVDTHRLEKVEAMNRGNEKKVVRTWSPSSLQNDLTMALGTSSLSLYELTKAYAVFANQGRLFKPIFIKKILDRDGNFWRKIFPFTLRENFPTENKS